MPKPEKAVLILEDGSRFEGFSFGYPAPAAGEVVFNTAMTGYPESLTDPSYEGQILVSTYPILGNYGVPSADVKSEQNVSEYFESANIHARQSSVRIIAGSRPTGRPNGPSPSG